MTVRLSEGLRNGLAQGHGFAGALNRGYINFYTGTQPVTADSAHGSTLLGTMSISGLALTKETRATGSVTITGATGGTINSITVGGLNIIPDGAITVSGDTTSTLATKLGAAINRNGIMFARVSAAVVTLYGRPGTGATTAAVAGSLTTATATYVAMGSGVVGVAPVNGLYLDSPVAGVIAKPAGVVWSMTAIATGTIGWARFYSSDTTDAGGAIVTLTEPLYSRLDGACGVGSGDFQLSSLAAVSSPASTHTLDAFSWTQPAA
jgi:hypothetical protein